MQLNEKIKKVIETGKCLKECKAGFNIDSVKTIEFGKYMQSESKSKTLEWILLGKSETSITLLSKYVLDCVKFNDTQAHIELRDSSLYRWLWNDFLNQAFSRDEQEYIRQIRCLSLKDINEFFDIENSTGNKNTALKAYWTEYAKEKERDGDMFSDYATYWLADNADDKICALFVDSDGYVPKNGAYVDFKFGIRPLLILELKS